MISAVYSNPYLGLSILDNSNGQILIVNDDLDRLEKYEIDDFSFEITDVVCDYIKQLFKNYKHPSLRALRKCAIKDFLASDFYAEFKAYIQERSE